jgi:23S rRNA pseudouridine1911/1915/1917 synthase
MDFTSAVQRIVAGSDVFGERLDVFLTRTLTSLSRAKIQHLIEQERVLLNGMPAAKKTQVNAGDEIAFEMPAASFGAGTGPAPQDIPLDILYEDDALVAVNKPAGMVVHPGNGVGDGTLVNALLHHVKSLSAGWEPDRPGIVHRLDKDTSGVVLAAKTDQVHAALGRMFEAREIHKQYIGICIGRRPDGQGSICEPLGRSRRDPVKRSVRLDGKDALTRYELAAHCSGVSVLRFMPHTGRTHQIRVHASAAGFPVLADSLYGGTNAAAQVAPLCRPFVASIYKCFTRHALHARSISFVHPVARTEFTVVAPFPQDFVNAFALFEKAGETVQGL